MAEALIASEKSKIDRHALPEHKAVFRDSAYSVPSFETLLLPYLCVYAKRRMLYLNVKPIGRQICIASETAW